MTPNISEERYAEASTDRTGRQDHQRGSTTHVTRNTNHDGPDDVQWLRTPGNTDRYIVRFDYPEGSPFQPGSQDIPVPPGAPHTVTRGQTHKVQSAQGYGQRESIETDDPDVIVD